jgi:hypothetical protein
MDGMSSTWPWLLLIGLGAFHGLNPAMGWLFAVGLGLHRQSRAVVLISLIPIAIGHALAIALVVYAITVLGAAIDRTALRAISAIALIGWGIYGLLYPHRHRVRIGLQTGLLGLAFWSFLMATVHGAGLMLIPALEPLQMDMSGAHMHHDIPGAHSLWIASLAVAVHTSAMLVVTGAIALIVYEWVGLGFLRRGWINVDLAWNLALIGTGLMLLLT